MDVAAEIITSISMIKISVVSYNNEAPAQTLFAIFDKNGGTLGRSDDNYFVLPDPKRYVSRLQASIRSDGTRHKIVNLSQANPILINGQEINSGQEYDLNAGDEIQIGLYLLQAELHSGVGEESRARSLISNGDVTQPQIIPDDFDPFALPSQASRNRSDPLADLSSNEISLESLKVGKADLDNLMSPASTSYGRSLLDASSLRMNSSSEVDPLVLFSSDSVLMAKPESDASGEHVVSNHVPEVNAHFMVPKANPTVSHEDENAASHVIGRQVLSAPVLFNSTSDPEPVLEEPDMNDACLSGNTVEIAPATPIDSEPTALPTILSGENPIPVANTKSVDSHELMQAFLRGAGTPPDTISSEVSPEFMEIIGKLLATSIQGTVELIASRALVKREVRADMTMIVAKKNNPLKFLPDGQAVLMQMLRENIPGFMEPVEAMQDAYEDLRAHQIGVVAGMRAAMAEVLERFNPELLEKRLKDHSFIDSVLPANRKAKMWDLYTELFEENRLKSQDDFQAIFGKSFVAAYEAEIERFKNGRQDD